MLLLVGGGCATSIDQIQQWEKAGNVTNLSQVATKKSEPPYVRKASLESLARLNWEPSNEERLQVYSLFASKGAIQDATTLMQSMSADDFTEIDKMIVAASLLLDANSGSWTNDLQARPLYDWLLAKNSKAVTISLCQQMVARPELQTRILLLAIKLGIHGSEDDLVAVLFEYGDVSMAEDYLNSGSNELSDGGRQWAYKNGYHVFPGPGSNRSSWGTF
jgi:hypothetical protein